MFRSHQQLDASGLACAASDEPSAFKLQHHAMDGGRRGAEVALHVGLRGRAPVELGVGVDEGQVLALKLGKGRGGEGNRHGGSEVVRLPFSWSRSA